MLYSKIEGTGNPNKLIIIHGFLGMSDNWKTMATKYASENFEVHLLDLRNHGRSFHAEEFNYPIMVADVKNYCETNHITKAAFLGHSMGGKVAMLFASTYPEIITKLLIADIGPKYYPQHHQNILAGLNAVDFSKITNRSEVESILEKYIAEYGTRQFLMKNLYWKTPIQLDFRFNLKTLTTSIEEIGKSLPATNHFNGETLFLRGEFSTYILDEDFAGIKSHFPKAVIKTISKAGHWLHAENPTDFYTESLSFLTK